VCSFDVDDVSHAVGCEVRVERPHPAGMDERQRDLIAGVDERRRDVCQAVGTVQPMPRGSTRRRFLGGAAALGAAALGFTWPALAAWEGAPLVRRLSVRGSGRRYAGDRDLFATVSPGVPGRDAAEVSFSLQRPSQVTVQAVRHGIAGVSSVVWEAEERCSAGDHVIVWEPALGELPGSYVLRVTSAANGRKRVYGVRRPASPERAVAPVVRVLDVEAAFERRAYAAFEPMRLTILADTPRLTLTFLRCGGETTSTDRSDEMRGVGFGEPVPIDWTGKRSGPVTITVQTGDWPTGLYASRLETPDGRVGFAPFVLRPSAGTGARTALVLPTHTWQAYNLYDRDGDGWGDTWYAGGTEPVWLDRPYRERGVPPRYRRYDLPFLHFIHRQGIRPDYLVDGDLDGVLSGDELRRRYDLLVFPGHSEYMTQESYDAVERFRDLGGRLIFLSANNFFWRVDKVDNSIRRVRKWRDLGRPEAALLGVQYRANDDGRAREPFVVQGVDAAPWLFAQTGLRNGDRLGDVVGGYGIEIDATTPASPPGTIVLARIEGLYGLGYDAEMTYYETAAGARVFSAGTLDFTASSRTWPVSRMLLNLWQHMLEDLPAPTPAPPTSS
jgi:hypothetical protein